MGSFSKLLATRFLGSRKKREKSQDSNGMAPYLGPILEKEAAQITAELEHSGVTGKPGLRPVIEITALTHAQHFFNRNMWPCAAKVPKDEILSLVNQHFPQKLPNKGVESGVTNTSALYLSPVLGKAVSHITEELGRQGISVTPGLRPVVEMMALVNVQLVYNPSMWCRAFRTPRDEIIDQVNLHIRTYGSES